MQIIFHVVDKIMTLINIQILSPGNCEYYHVWQVDSHVSGTLQRSSLSWDGKDSLSYSVVSKCKHKYLNKINIEKILMTETHREQGDKMQRLEYCGHKPRNASSHQKLKEVRDTPSPGPSGRSQPCRSLNFVVLVEN